RFATSAPVKPLLARAALIASPIIFFLLSSMAILRDSGSDKVKQRQCIGFVVIGWLVTLGLHRRDNFFLAGIAFACDVFFDGSDCDSLIRNLLFLTPCGESAEEPAISMGSIYTHMAAHLLEMHRSDGVIHLVHLIQPLPE